MGADLLHPGGKLLLLPKTSNLFISCTLFGCNAYDSSPTWGVRGSRVWMMGSELMRDTNLV